MYSCTPGAFLEWNFNNDLAAASRGPFEFQTMIDTVKSLEAVGRIRESDAWTLWRSSTHRVASAPRIYDGNAYVGIANLTLKLDPPALDERSDPVSHCVFNQRLK